jgi:hypothetical protein
LRRLGAVTSVAPARCVAQTVDIRPGGAPTPTIRMATMTDPMIIPDDPDYNRDDHRRDNYRDHHDRQPVCDYRYEDTCDQMEVRRDTEKIAKLSAELRDALDASNGQVLSLDLVKKAETIGKLAKSVKD